jgi:hypothetical protein
MIASQPRQERRTTRPLRALGAVLGIWLAVSLSGGSAVSAREPLSPREIMEQVTLTRRLDGSEAVVTMTIINAKGQTRERKLSMATKLFEGGRTEKRIYRFLSPADVEGTGVLVFDYESAADDVWVYLPSLRKTRRILGAQRSEGFMGSEFSYADLNVPALDDYSYSLLGEEPEGGEPCWLIEVSPKSDEIARSEGYSKKKYWVSQAKFVVQRAVYLDLEGRPLKELRNADFKLLDAKQKRYRPLRMEMVNLQNSRRSLFTSEQLVFAPGAKDDYFTPRYLERP